MLVLTSRAAYSYTTTPIEIVKLQKHTLVGYKMG